MPEYTIYRLSDGAISGVKNVPENSIALNVPEGHSFVIGSIDGNEFHIVNGKPRKKPDPLASAPIDELRNRAIEPLERSTKEAIRNTFDPLLMIRMFEGDQTAKPEYNKMRAAILELDQQRANEVAAIRSEPREKLKVRLT